jgi:FkbM family methyltransferase
MDDVLIWCHRKLGPIARKLGVQRIARRVYDEIASRRFPPGRLVTARQNGRVWKLRREVAERGEFQEPDTIAWLRRVVRPGMTVIDVGANVGQMTLEMAALVGAGGRVIAVEPGVGNLEYLRQHVQGNDLADRVTIVEAACAEADGGEVTFFVASDDGATGAVGSGHNIVGADAIYKQNSQLQVREQRVPRVSIDGLCARLAVRPDVIKVDVEGAELMVVKGAQHTLALRGLVLRVGFHPFAFDDPGAASKELLGLAEGAGYRVSDVPPDGTLRLAEYNWSPK